MELDQPDVQLKEVLTHFQKIALAVLHGSVASGHQRVDSDLDIAVAAKQFLAACEKIVSISAWADRTGRSSPFFKGGCSVIARLTANGQSGLNRNLNGLVRLARCGNKV